MKNIIIPEPIANNMTLELDLAREVQKGNLTNQAAAAIYQALATA